MKENNRSLDWKRPQDDYSIRNLTVEVKNFSYFPFNNDSIKKAETDWRYCFPTVNTHQERSKIEGAKESFLYLFDKKSDLQGGIQGKGHHRYIIV